MTGCFPGIAKAQSETIRVDIREQGRINVSQLAKDIIPIQLKGTNKFIDLSVRSVVPSENGFFILLAMKKGTGRISSFYEFDIKGKLLRQIGPQDKNGEFLRITELLYDEEKENIYLRYGDGFAIYDNRGNFISRRNKQLGRYIFNNRMWDIDYDFDKKKIYGHLLAKNLYKTDTIHSFSLNMPSITIQTNAIAFPFASYRIIDDLLYISLDFTNEIIAIDRAGDIKLRYKFVPKQKSKVVFNPVVHPGRKVFRDYIYYGFRLGTRSYFCMYNRINQESVSLESTNMGRFNAVACINDDILGTGLFELKSTGPFFFFVKKAGDIPVKIKGLKDNTNPVIFFLKTKSEYKKWE